MLKQFTKSALYRTPYGIIRALGPIGKRWDTARAKWVTINPVPTMKAWEFQIVQLHADAERMGYKRGDIIEAHLDDCTTPSPQDWEHIKTLTAVQMTHRDDYGWPAGQ